MLWRLHPPTIMRKIMGYRALSISSTDLGVDSLDEVSASGPLVSFTSLGSDDDDDGKERALRAISATWLLL